MPTGVEVARTLSLRSLPRLIQRGALFAAITVSVGVLVAQTPEELRTRAEQGNARAQAILGGMYYDGRGVPQDYAEAVRWYRLAAEQGDAVGQFSLGGIYALGKRLPQDYVQAHKWLRLAVSLASAEEKKIYASARDRVGGKMTSAQIAEAQRLAREWKPKTWGELKGKAAQ